MAEAKSKDNGVLVEGCTNGLLTVLCDAMRKHGLRSLSLNKLKTGRVNIRWAADKGKDIRDFQNANVQFIADKVPKKRPEESR